MSFNITEHLSRPMGSVLAAAVRSYISVEENGNDRIDLENFDFKIMINGKEVPLDKFASLVNSDAQFGRTKAALQKAREEVNVLKNFLTEASPADIAQRIINDFKARVNEIDLGAVLTPIHPEDYVTSESTDIRTRIDNTLAAIDTVVTTL